MIFLIIDIISSFCGFFTCYMCCLLKNCAINLDILIINIEFWLLITASSSFNETWGVYSPVVRLGTWHTGARMRTWSLVVLRPEIDVTSYIQVFLIFQRLYPMVHDPIVMLDGLQGFETLGPATGKGTWRLPQLNPIRWQGGWNMAGFVGNIFCW